MKRLALILAVLVVLTGCTGQSKQGGVGGKYESVIVDTEDGDVHCITFDSSTGGGNIDCNWDRHNKLNEIPVKQWLEPYGGCDEAVRYPKSPGYAECVEHGLLP